MIKVKNIVISAVCAFVLSFLISIISTGKIGPSLLRALIAAAVFAAIAFAATFLSDKFLQVEGDSLQPDAVPKRTAGGQVDLVVDDEDLTEEGDGPDFAVPRNAETIGAGSSSFSSSGVSREEPRSAEMQPLPPDTEISSLPENDSDSSDVEASSPEGFVPVELGREDKNSGPQVRKTERDAQREERMKEIDSLPDIDGFDSDEEPGSDTGLVEDSDFAESGETKVQGYSVIDADKAKDHDTETMANAIRTLLKREE